MIESFQEKICRRFDVPVARYEETMMQRTFYPHARWLRWVGSRRYLSVDRSFIASVGRLTHRRDLSGEIRDFRLDARNRSFWRGTARLRVSAGRMQRLFREVWSEGEK